MPDHPRLSELLLRWEELRAQGREVTAAELCQDCPEQAPKVARQLAALRAVYQVLDTARDNGPAPEAGTGPPDPDQFATAYTTALQDTQLHPGTVPPDPDPFATRITASPHSPIPAAALYGWPAVPGYEILEELGRGGMGVVYKARQEKLGRLVALKMILSGPYAGPEARARFHTEAEAVARLQHPHIVQIHEVGEAGGRPFFSLEFVEGGSLAHRLDGTPLPSSRAAQLVEKLARAMQAAHEKGILHRDLKPANILLTADGTPKVTDFGLAKLLDSEQGSSAGQPGASAPGGPTETGAVLGTPSYMAPKQAGGKTKDIGPAVDVYALGAILYELLTGRPPFRAETPLDTLLQVIGAEPVPPSRLNRKVPGDLETICLQCLNKEPAKRYRSAIALAADLQRFQAGEPIHARPVGLLGRGLKWVRRRPAYAALLGIVFLVVLASAIVGLWFWNDVQTRRLRTAREVNIALQEASELRGKAETVATDPALWKAALTAAERAEAAQQSGEADEETSDRIRALVGELKTHWKKALVDAEARQRKLQRRIDHEAYLKRQQVDGCVASTNLYRPTTVVSPPNLDLGSSRDRPPWPNPDYSGFAILRTSVFVDLSRWTSIPLGRLPESAGRIEPAIITRVIDLIRKENVTSNNRIAYFQFRTEGFEYDLHCPDRNYVVRGSIKREQLGGTTKPVLVREIAVDLSDVPLGKEVRVIIQGTSWNGYQYNAQKKQWAAILAPDFLSEAELAVRFARGQKPSSAPALFEFLKGSPRRQVPTLTPNFNNPLDQDWWVWKPRDIKKDYVYQIEWDWKPVSPK